MNYTITNTGYAVFYDFAGESYPVGIIHINESIEEAYTYTDTLFNSAEIVLRHCYLSDLHDAVSDYYSSRDTIGAIEEKWL
jgi:hypothetical protein